MTLRRLLPLSGVAFVVIALGSIVGIGGDTPTTEDSADKVFSFYADNTVQQSIAAFVFAVSAPFLIFFAISLIERTRATDDADASIWRTVHLVGAGLMAGAVLVTSMIHFALADGADQDISPVALQALVTLDSDSWLLFNPALGVMMLGAAGLILRGAPLPSWLGWTALLFGIALFIPFADFFALILTLVWIIIVSILLFRQESASTAAPLAGPAT
jgi:hypothetical protein